MTDTKTLREMIAEAGVLRVKHQRGHFNYADFTDGALWTARMLLREWKASECGIGCQKLHTDKLDAWANEILGEGRC